MYRGSVQSVLCGAIRVCVASSKVEEGLDDVSYLLSCYVRLVSLLDDILHMGREHLSTSDNRRSICGNNTRAPLCGDESDVVRRASVGSLDCPSYWALFVHIRLDGLSLDANRVA